YLRPEGAPVLAVEVQGVDILVFFGRVFGIFDRTVRALVEPVWMLMDIGVVWGAIDGKIEGDFHAAFVDLGHEPFEVFESAEFGCDVFVPPAIDALVTVADGVGNTWIGGEGGEGVVFTFALGDADGVDGGE